MAQLPSGTVTFLFTDIERSTQLLQHLGNDYARVLEEHQALLRAAWSAHGGAEIDTAGDGFFVAFASAPEAVAAAADATRVLAEHAWPEGVPLRVRIGLHTGTPQLEGDHYIGLDVHRAARIAAAGHGGQVLLSQTTRSLVAHALPQGATLRDVGAHRLKDLQEPEPLYQLVLLGLPSDFPPLRTLNTRLNNLPIQPTPLLGREEQVAMLCTLLRREDVRLVTLTGPGGSGKTRLSIQVAAELMEDFSDGVWFVRLSHLVDPDLLLPTVAQTVGLKEQGSQPIAELLREYLHPKRVLLVLDNFEQVAGAAEEVAALQEATPQLKVLVTSRVSLHLRGEREYPLGPLPVPDPAHLPAPEVLNQYAAVALFTERARGSRPEFTVTAANAPAIAEICARLDGLPLAIELAASRVKLLPPEALLARLSSQLKLLTGGARDAEERQQTMRATITWSEALLTPAERVLFRRLSVFVGDCTLEAAEAVCVASDGAEPLAIDLLDGLQRLVDQSLVQQRAGNEDLDGEPRFGMLHVIREFALEHLEASGESEALRRAHAQFVLTLAAESPVGLCAGSDARWLARLEWERDNVRAALGWALDRGEVRLSLRLGGGIAPFWWARGYYTEGRRWLAHIVAGGPALMGSLESSAARGDRDVALVALRAWGLWWMAKLAGNQDDIELARAWARECLDAAHTSGDPALTAVALSWTGCMELAPPPRDTQRGKALLAQAISLARRTNNQEVLVRVLGDRFGALVDAVWELDRALALADELLAAARHLDTLTLVNVEEYVNSNLAEVARRQGDIAAARSYAERALRPVLELGYTVWAVSCLQVLAWVADRMGDGERAARLLGASAAEAERQGILGYLEKPEFLAVQSSIGALLGEEGWEAAVAAGKALPLAEAVAEALGDVNTSELPSA
jgi:predicted ATPase/class 3 adenylate cyclase